MMTTLQQQESTAPATRTTGGSQNAKSHPSRTIVHAKLEMTEPGDHDEQEADAVANTVVSGGKIARKISGGGGSSGIAVSQQMESQLSQLQGGGRQMPDGLRNMMESGFGQDFSQVRLHTDSEAASMSNSIQAKAFTLGNDIYFNRGQFAPETSEGQHLLAHELTHVVQGTGKVGRKNDKTTAFDSIKVPEYLASVKTLIDHLIDDIALTQVGLKKKQDGKTQYQKDIGAGSGDWCDWFVHWCFIKAFNPIDFEDKHNLDNTFTAISKRLLNFTMYEEFEEDPKKDPKHMSGSVSKSMGFFLDSGTAFVREGSDTNQMNKTIDARYKKEGEKKWRKPYKALFNRLQEAKSFEELLMDQIQAEIKQNQAPAETKQDQAPAEMQQDQAPTEMQQDQAPTETKSSILNKILPNELVSNLNDFQNNLTSSLENHHIIKRKPQKGDVVFFVGHIGLVKDASDDGEITTIEGNTVPNTDDVYARGNGVWKKVYSPKRDLTAYNKIMGFGRPDYTGLLSFLRDVYEKELYKNENKNILQEMYPQNAQT